MPGKFRSRAETDLISWVIFNIRAFFHEPMYWWQIRQRLLPACIRRASSASQCEVPLAQRRVDPNIDYIPTMRSSGNDGLRQNSL